jgi:flavin-dependent dehydrogenase
VGASFAGLRCAKAAARRGLRVVVLEQKPRAGARLRTTGILVKEAAAEMDFPAQLSRKVPGVRLYAPNGKHIELTSPGYAFHATDTGALLDWMADEVQRAGADLCFNCAFRGATPIKGGYDLDGTGLATRYLVGADGAKSPVAAVLGLSRNRHFLYGIEVGVPLGDQVDTRFLHCFLSGTIAPGYIAWAVPGPHHLQIGLATSLMRKPSIDDALSHVRKLMTLDRLPITERRAGVIPCGGGLRNIGNERALLLGDAAGLVSPLTAGGIQPALHFGRRAGHVIADYLLDEGPSPSAVFEREYPKFRGKRLQRAAMNVGVPDFVWNAALGTPPVRGLAQWLYFHRRTPGPRLRKEGIDFEVARA